MYSRIARRTSSLSCAETSSCSCGDCQARIEAEYLVAAISALRHNRYLSVSAPVILCRPSRTTVPVFVSIMVRVVRHTPRLRPYLQRTAAGWGDEGESDRRRRPAPELLVAYSPAVEVMTVRRPMTHLTASRLAIAYALLTACAGTQWWVPFGNETSDCPRALCCKTAG